MHDSVIYSIHVILTLIIGIAIQIAWMKFSSHLEEKRMNDRIDEVSMAIGKSARNTENNEESLSYLRNKFSQAKFENRITDAIGTLIKAIHLPISIMITIWYFLMIAGKIFGFMPMEALALWIPMILQLALSIAVLVVSVFTKILFGRYPGEARGFNKELAKTLI
ncbi:superinfection exclusion protein A [Serratia marcescens]|uniref:superinfection exclusion protein A n=1 Tax=Serratia ureilytica TaxID=300181 RepID=UPI0018D60FB8|nr:superinfection exclusion protein A [Serratia ureilytica]MBH2720139.1 superinfection exclusion protein A [Serratia ureilytica]